MNPLYNDNLNSPIENGGWRLTAVAVTALLLLASGTDRSGLFAQGGDRAFYPQVDKVKAPPKKKEAEDTASAEGTASETEGQAAKAPQMSRLFPIGRPFKGVRIPSYTGDTLDSVVTAEVMRRLDEERLDLETLVITSFGEGEEADTRIYMDHAIYNMTTEKLTSETPTRIIQPQFEMRGDKMVFDNKTQVGHMTGNVRMLIFEVDQVFTGGILSEEGTE